MADISTNKFSEPEAEVPAAFADIGDDTMDILDIIAVADAPEHEGIMSWFDEIAEKIANMFHGDSRELEEALELEGESLVTKALAVLTLNKLRNKTTGMVKMAIILLLTVGLAVVAKKVYPVLQAQLQSKRSRL